MSRKDFKKCNDINKNNKNNDNDNDNKHNIINIIIMLFIIRIISSTLTYKDHVWVLLIQLDVGKIFQTSFSEPETNKFSFL